MKGARVEAELDGGRESGPQARLTDVEVLVLGEGSSPRTRVFRATVGL